MPEWIISAAELKERLSQVILVDVREDEEWAESRIPGALHIPLGDLGNRALRELPKEADIVLHCAHGVRSLHALMSLKQLGYENVRSLEGGIVAWEQAGNDTKPR
jgi:rhodanese-related sulfurtransferase